MWNVLVDLINFKQILTSIVPETLGRTLLEQVSRIITSTEHGLASSKIVLPCPQHYLILALFIKSDGGVSLNVWAF